MSAIKNHYFEEINRNLDNPDPDYFYQKYIEDQLYSGIQNDETKIVLEDGTVITETQ